MARDKIWLIDENPDQLTTYTNVLGRLFPELRVEPVQVKARKDEYVEPQLMSPETACIVIDQKLKETGVATYLGIDLALYFRGINTKLPIYILTNYADDAEQFEEGAWSVEDIIDKREIADLDSKHARDLKARVLRRIDVYNDLLAERERRFQQLLRKSLTTELTQAEMRELDELQSIRGAAIAASEVELLARAEATLLEFESKLNKVEKDQETKSHDAE